MLLRIDERITHNLQGIVANTEHEFYTRSWQRIEARPGGENSTIGVKLFVYGIRYIDDIVLRIRDANESGPPEEKRYYLTDANYNVIMTIDDAAHPAEHIFYKAYGEPECFPFGDVDGDYDVDSNDGTLLVSMKNGNSPYNIFGDLNLDGQITQADVNLISNYAGMLGGTNILSTNEEQNDIGYAAYIWNDESQNYHVRNREYSPKLGRWLQRDPIGYRSKEYNLYEYAVSTPLSRTDSSGLVSCDSGYHPSEHYWKIPDGYPPPKLKICIEWDMNCIDIEEARMYNELLACLKKVTTNPGLAPWTTTCMTACIANPRISKNPVSLYSCLAGCIVYGVFGGTYNAVEMLGWLGGCFIDFHIEWTIWTIGRGAFNKCCRKWIEVDDPKFKKPLRDKYHDDDGEFRTPW